MNRTEFLELITRDIKEPGCEAVYKSWLHEYESYDDRKSRSINCDNQSAAYHNLTGVLWGLMSVGHITDDERQQAQDFLIEYGSECRSKEIKDRYQDESKVQTATADQEPEGKEKEE